MYYRVFDIFIGTDKNEKISSDQTTGLSTRINGMN